MGNCQNVTLNAVTTYFSSRSQSVNRGWKVAGTVGLSHDFVTITEYGKMKSVNFIPPVNRNKCSLLEILTTPKEKLSKSHKRWLVLLYWLPDSEYLLLLLSAFLNGLLIYHVLWERFTTFRPKMQECAHHAHQVSSSFSSNKLLFLFQLIVKEICPDYKTKETVLQADPWAFYYFSFFLFLCILFLSF